jgi:hypothetical protein
MPAARSTLACIPCRSARHKCAGNPPRFPDHDGSPSQNPVRLAEQSCIRCERMSKECWWMPSGRTGKRSADQEVRDKRKGPSESPLPHSIPTATKTLLNTSTTSPGATLPWHTLLQQYQPTASSGTSKENGIGSTDDDPEWYLPLDNEWPSSLMTLPVSADCIDPAVVGGSFDSPSCTKLVEREADTNRRTTYELYADDPDPFFTTIVTGGFEPNPAQPASLDPLTRQPGLEPPPGSFPGDFSAESMDTDSWIQSGQVNRERYGVARPNCH